MPGYTDRNYMTEFFQPSYIQPFNTRIRGVFRWIIWRFENVISCLVSDSSGFDEHDTYSSLAQRLSAHLAARGLPPGSLCLL